VICVGRFRVLLDHGNVPGPGGVAGTAAGLGHGMHWRPKDRRARWALLIGAFAGWAAITRPVDAAAFALRWGWRC